MGWDLSADRAIYLQLMEQVKLRILSGVYPVGSRLPAVRDLACEASVNPNTMQKALAELEREGLIYSQRTTGRFITDDEDMVLRIREALAREQITSFLARMRSIGFDKMQTQQMIHLFLEEEDQ